MLAVGESPLVQIVGNAHYGWLIISITVCQLGRSY
ncbi:hypothetical protein BVRB_5g125050 [Beta vulgaris subsp. vulgaris]|uniref:Uncharacterized protein n=1 Tax=Beta vulgaris subsp. vulgaris TaxID=3555 RepID=A0A0J8BCG7_BETVV|nr:hypothetical protein BVRB_5g125050 [Beta vulgaris subsp. vulgaris]